MKRLVQYSILFLAANYFCFRVELFEHEDEANHRTVDTHEHGIGTQTVNWETFDKDNAPKAFVFHAEIQLHILHITAGIITFSFIHHVSDDLIRDKSPPLPFLAS